MEIEAPDREAPPVAEREPAAPGPGGRLRGAREARKLTLAQVAAELRLDPHLVEALEKDDHGALPAPIFVRGYLRHYARLVGLEDGPLLAAYDAQGVPEPRPRLSRAGARRPLVAPTVPWRSLGMLVVVVLIGGVLALFGPGLVKRLHMPGSNTADTSGTVMLPPMAQVPEGAPPAQALPSIMPSPPVPAAPAPQPPADAPAAVAAPTPAVAPAVAPPAPAAGQATLELKLAAASWVEVHDAHGKRLLVGLLGKGADRTVSGTPPFSVLLGKSNGVTVLYNGKPFDQSRYNRDNVARFKVGDGTDGN